MIWFIGLLLISGCAAQSLETTTTSSPTLQPALGTVATIPTVPTPADAGAGPEISQLATLAEIVPTRTPERTATPDALDEAVEEVVQETGLSGVTLLGLRIEDWFNLGISALIVIIAYLLGTWVIRWLIPRLIQRTKTDLDDRLLQVSGRELRWLVVVFILRFATNRLTIVDVGLKTILFDIYFLLILLLSIVILWRLINLIAQEAGIRVNQKKQEKVSESLITLMVWGLRLVLIIIAISVSLTHFGVNITGFAVFLGIVVLVVSFSGRNILADIIAGAMILVDRPYRIGDRIELDAIDTWGDVLDIGMRSTKVLTLDNRMVIIPNSHIGEDQIVNYSYPDPSYYDQNLIGVAYENDFEQVEKLLLESMGSVEGVMSDRDVDAVLSKFTESQVVFQIGWWIKSYDEIFVIRNRVNQAVVRALKDAGVVLPYRKTSIDLGTDGEIKMLNGEGNEEKINKKEESK